MALGRNPLAQGVPTPARDGKAENAPLSVSEALGSAKRQVSALGTLAVTGEVSGFRGPNSRSGHCYFQVKDDESTMDAIVWRSTYAKLAAPLRDGLTVVMRGKFDVYKGSGRLSFVASSVEPAGEGLLRQQVAELARKLEAEGLMDPARKRPIPRFCMRVAVVTSLSGSVIEDVKRTLRRRNPLVQLDVVGCAVQGPGAPATIAQALAVAAAAQPEAILLVRGGGSFEDLMTFNDEGLARAVACCPVPVITGIGHEPDTSICDMVSDRRASTPTAAAESVAPAIDEVAQVVEGRRQRMGAALAGMLEERRLRVQTLDERARRSVATGLESKKAQVEALSAHRCLENPFGFVEERAIQLMQSEQRLHDSMPRVVAGCENEVQTRGRRLQVAGEGLLRPHDAALARMAASLEALSPLKVLSRGYAIARDEQGRVVSDVGTLARGQKLSVALKRGEVLARVEEIHKGQTTPAGVA